MKNILIIFAIASCISLHAQPPQGGFAGRDGARRPPMERKEGENRQEFGIMNLPDIPGLTSDQREKLTKLLSKEHKEINKINQKRDNIRVQTENPSLKANEKANGEKLMAKLDEKTEKVKVKYDKKYRAIFSEEQYEVFIKHREEIEFRKPPRRNEFKSKGMDPQEPFPGPPPADDLF